MQSKHMTLIWVETGDPLTQDYSYADTPKALTTATTSNCGEHEECAAAAGSPAPQLTVFRALRPSQPTPWRERLAVTAASGGKSSLTSSTQPDRQLTLPQALPTATNWPVRRVPCLMMTVATGPCPLSRDASTTTPSAARLVLAFSSSRSACRQRRVLAGRRQGGARRCPQRCL